MSPRCDADDSFKFICSVGGKIKAAFVLQGERSCQWGCVSILSLSIHVSVLSHTFPAVCEQTDEAYEGS